MQQNPLAKMNKKYRSFYVNFKMRTDNRGASDEESRDSIHDSAQNTKENGELVAKSTPN